ncbi:septum site-determining protein MinC [Halolactibacillus halophilus]|uniref:Probable septum site-determining protein MinC n=1 Tax=Halolactibacillus halophilus TaxID=306540 RepID=A0A1I5L064_9BACI|nr:septum site-determining protein MinC [Halolactibacillus halophilus]GEM00586.1 putative septum site-determining protein MinC [Halolactibacillus halophilus]SFO90677.1 septum site-determining protein MinC [Halolactibacillus halophilus]
MSQKPLVMIKGTRDGLTLFLSDDASFHDVKEQLVDMLNQDDFDEVDSLITIKVELGNRLLHTDEREELKTLIQSKRRLVVQDIVSNVITKQEALALKKASDIHLHMRPVRSGQVVDIVGDVLVIGDVNPGGTVKATGNVFILGALRGIAHAGYEGNKDVVIVASLMNPVQLRIAEFYSRAPDYETDGVYMECAYIEKGQIVMDRLQQVMKKCPVINGFERSVLNV